MDIITSGFYGSPLKPKPIVPNQILCSPQTMFSRPTWFEFRGTNGSGKSSLPYTMISMDPKASKVEYKTEIEGEPTKLKLVLLPFFNTILVGDYPIGRAVGGLDTVSGSTKIEEHLVFAKEMSEKLGLHRILFEGIMTSTSNVRWTSFLLGERIGATPEDIHIMWANTPLDVCMERVYLRSGKDFNRSLVESKFSQLRNQPQVHQQTFPDVNRWFADCLCSKTQMVENYMRFEYDNLPESAFIGNQW